MTRRVFFSFHYADVVRAMNVRNSWVVRRDNEEAGFVDAAEFEAVERHGDGAIQRWIDEQLKGTSVTVVLIGQHTWGRPYVQYEIRQSFTRGNGLLGIHITGIRDFLGRTESRGQNPFSYTRVPGTALLGGDVPLLVRPPVYDWAADDGRENIDRWIEAVAPRPRGSL